MYRCFTDLLTKVIALLLHKRLDDGKKVFFLVDENCFDSCGVSYLWDKASWDLFFCDDEKPGFFGEFEVVSDCLSDADVVVGDDGCNRGKDARCTGVFRDDFDDSPMHGCCDVFEMAGWCEF